MAMYPVLEPLKYNGQRYKPGEDVEMESKHAAACAAVGDAISPKEPEQPNNNPADNQDNKETALSDTEVENPAADEQSSQDPLEEIVDAIAGLDAENESHWTNDGKPDSRSLSAVLGRIISATDRDAAWERYQSSLTEK